MPPLPLLLMLVAATTAGCLAGWQVARRRSRLRIEELSRQLEFAHQEARTDSLTELWNRKAFDEQLQIQAAIARRYKLPLTVVLIDVDHFKQINDTRGHAVGDAVLRELARRLRESVRDADLVARYGGEEFALLLPQTPLEGGVQVAERIRQQIAASPISAPASEVVLTASAGVAALQLSETAADLVHRADSALYQSKQTGRNRVSPAASSHTPPGPASI